MVHIKALIDEDFVQYKKPSIFIGFSKCSFKCDKECGKQVCQNSTLANTQTIAVFENDIVDRYLTNQITNSIVFGGLEPFDTFDELILLIDKFREHTNDDIVIYTGYNKEEIQIYVKRLKRNKYTNIIIKYGRFVPNQSKHYDSILGVYLASDNQYAEIISKK